MLSATEIKEILSNAKTIAVVGLSENPVKASYRVAKYLKEKGYHIIPVNLKGNEVLGNKVYRNLLQITERVDIVNIFLPSEKVMPVVKEAVELSPKAIWMQLGIINQEAAKYAEKRGIKVIMDKCIRKTHRELL